MELQYSVESETKMKQSPFLMICFILLPHHVLTVTEDKPLEEIKFENGLDERAEGLIARLEALKEVEEELKEFREESGGGLSGNLFTSEGGNLKAEKRKESPNDARELLARLTALKKQSGPVHNSNQSGGIDSQKDSLDSTLRRRAKGKESDAKELLAGLTQIKEHIRVGFAPEETILGGAGMGKDQNEEGNERLKELSATLDSLLYVNSVKGSGRDRFGGKFKVGPKQFKSLRQLSTFEEPTLGKLDLGSLALAENVGQGDNVFLFLLSGSEKPQFSIHA